MKDHNLRSFFCYVRNCEDNVCMTDFFGKSTGKVAKHRICV